MAIRENLVNRFLKAYPFYKGNRESINAAVVTTVMTPVASSLDNSESQPHALCATVIVAKSFYKEKFKKHLGSVGHWKGLEPHLLNPILLNDCYNFPLPAFLLFFHPNLSFQWFAYSV